MGSHIIFNDDGNFLRLVLEKYWDGKNIGMGTNGYTMSELPLLRRRTQRRRINAPLTSFGRSRQDL